MSQAFSPPRFVISRLVLDAVYRHCEFAYPEEACGIIVGPEGRPTGDRFCPCTNIQNRLHRGDPSAYPRDARSAYRIDPAELFTLTRDCRACDEHFKAVVHSHADVGAYFSDEDQRQAAPQMPLSVAAFARGEGCTEADVLEELAAGRLVADDVGRVVARVPTYPELVYLVVDVTRNRARGVRGFFWSPRDRTYVETQVRVSSATEDEVA
ncbi:MAG: Mov34/MPN/PAD-1 family protein [Nitrospirota bacterium]|nr:Mov34/MPN/PAD-1 family protein [Nitrospirota bacterium]